MKKLILTLSLALVTSWCIHAQVRLGLELSPEFSWMTSSDPLISRTGTNLGIKLAANLEYYFSERISLTTGLGLAFNRGGTLRHEFGGNFLTESDLSSDEFNSGPKPLPDGVKIKYKLQYLELPFGLKFRTHEMGYLRYFFEFPRIIWGVNVQARGAIEAGDLVNTEKENILPDVQVISISWGVGAGVEYSLAENTSLIGGIYYSRGLVDVTRNKGTKAIDDPDQDPSDPDDDYIFESEDSKGVVNVLTIRIGIVF